MLWHSGESYNIIPDSQAAFQAVTDNEAELDYDKKKKKKKKLYGLIKINE